MSNVETIESDILAHARQHFGEKVQLGGQHRNMHATWSSVCARRQPAAVAVTSFLEDALTLPHKQSTRQIREQQHKLKCFNAYKTVSFPFFELPVNFGSVDSKASGSVLTDMMWSQRLQTETLDACVSDAHRLVTCVIAHLRKECGLVLCASEAPLCTAVFRGFVDFVAYNAATKRFAVVEVKLDNVNTTPVPSLSTCAQALLYAHMLHEALLLPAVDAYTVVVNAKQGTASVSRVAPMQTWTALELLMAPSAQVKFSKASNFICTISGIMRRLCYPQLCDTKIATDDDNAAWTEKTQPCEMIARPLVGLHMRTSPSVFLQPKEYANVGVARELLFFAALVSSVDIQNRPNFVESLTRATTAKHQPMTALEYACHVVFTFVVLNSSPAALFTESVWATMKQSMKNIKLN